MVAQYPPSHPGAPIPPADAVVFGEALIDLFPVQPGLPLEEVEQFARHLGGAPANLAVGLARQGVRVALATLVGSDAFGRFVQARLDSEGVLTDSVGICAQRGTRTGVTFVSVGVRGERSFLFYRHPSADMMITPADVQPAHVQRGRLFHFGSSTLSREPSRAATLKALELCQKGRSRRLISCDVNLRPHLWPDIKEAGPLLRKVLAGCDIVKLTPVELPVLFQTESTETAASRLRALGVTIVVVTLGEGGCYVDAPQGQAYLAAETVSVVDKTGAGDAFTAGLLSQLLEKLGGPGPDELPARLKALGMEHIKRACAHGNHLGAQVCTAIGATTNFPKKKLDDPVLR